MSYEIISIEEINNLINKIERSFLVNPLAQNLSIVDRKIFKKNEKITKDDFNKIIECYNKSITNGSFNPNDVKKYQMEKVTTETEISKNKLLKIINNLKEVFFDYESHSYINTGIGVKIVKAKKYNGQLKVEAHELINCLNREIPGIDFNYALPENKQNWFGCPNFVINYFSFSTNYYQVIGYNMIESKDFLQFNVEVLKFKNV